MPAIKSADLAADPVLKRVRAALDELYGDRIERVILFGSRARGDAHEDSDYDVAVFLRNFTDRWSEASRLAALSTDLIGETGEVINALPFPAGVYRERTPLMHELRIDGVDMESAISDHPGFAAERRANRLKPERALFSRSEAGGMTPEAALYLAKAKQCLEHGRAILAIGLGEDAGRDAYLAGFHAAQALIFERSGRAVKTHRGVRIRFEQLAPGEAGIDDELRQFLAKTYDLKTIADYDTDPASGVSLEEAGSALETAARLIDSMTAALA